MKVYMKDKPQKFDYKCFVLYGDIGLLTRLKFTEDMKMIPNSGKLWNLIWEKVAAL
jgi:hypothetical protein